MLTPAQIIECHKLISVDNPKSYVDAAQFLLESQGEKVSLKPEQGKVVISSLFHSFLDNDLYSNAALLAWGDRKFNPEPQEVQRIWNALHGYSKNLLMGAASEGKSFNTVIYFLLDWVRDPEFTNVKIISTSESHAQANAWSTILDFHRSSVVELPGEPTSEFITIRRNDKQAAMAVVAIPPGEDSKARLQGFHPLPRRTPHPKFGILSRVRAYIDEAEKVAAGLWEGIDNLTASETKEGSVKICASTNPVDVSSAFAKRAEPVEGWQTHDPDKDFEWVSKQGWHVVRLDAAQNENVKQKKVVYHGLQTYEGFQNLVRLGKSNPRYWTFARGTYPVSSVEYGIIPPAFLRDTKKVFSFYEDFHNVASLDPAFAEGGDEAVLTTGRYGMANGYMEGSNFISFPPRPVLQVEQQFSIKKGNTLVMAANIMEILRKLHVRPEYFVMDKTGIGWGLYDVLKVQFGDCMGVLWSNEATEYKILQEDTGVPKDKYKGIVSEMWFATAKWIEFGYLKFSPLMDTSDLFTELSGRKYSAWGKFDKVEAKQDYKDRTDSSSPDSADSLVMLVHLCRIRSSERPTMLPKPPQPQKSRGDWDWSDPSLSPEWKSDVPDYIDFDF